jgi:hypothetical protein
VSRETAGARQRYAVWVAILLLLLLFGLLTAGARRLSMTQDEPAHVVAGYALLARGADGFWTYPQRGHPPLIDLLEGFLLFLSHPNVPLEQLDGWGYNFVSYVADWRPFLLPAERTEALSRTPIMLLTVLLGAVVFRWGKELAGAGAAVLALVVLTFDPLLLAHGRLATNDLGVTVLGTLAIFAAWFWMQTPLWRWALLTGVLLGLTALAKASGVLAALAFVGLAALAVAWEPSQRKRSLLAGQAGVVILCAFEIVWGAYGFSFGTVDFLPFPVPAPEHWGHFARYGGVATRRIFSAFGTMWTGRQWWYYPFNMLVRNPLPFLIGLVIAGVALLKWARDNARAPGQMDYGARNQANSAGSHMRQEHSWVLVGIFPVLYILVALVWGTSVGYRHMLPVHPYLYLLIGAGLWVWVRRGAAWHWVTVGLLGLWYTAGTLYVFPNEITFFNELVGGPREGYRYLVDYTQDWGQSFKQLRSWLETNPGPRPKVAYFTRMHPGFYGLDIDPMRPADGADPLAAPFRPLEGRYVVGVTPLQGVVGPDRMALEWFRRVPPSAKVGETLFVYDVEPFDGSWLAQCHVPAVPLTETAIQNGLGARDPRQVNFDCTQSWIYPGGGSENGWYVFHGQHFAPGGLRQRLLYDAPQAKDPFLTRHLRGSRFSYQQEDASLLPPFVLYEASVRVEQPEPIGVWGAGAGTPPIALPSGAALKTPVVLDGPADFLGIQVVRDGETVDVETWWRVKQGPVVRPLSLSAHLITAGGQTLAVADGLGVQPVEWLQGDVLVQRHVFSQPPEATKVWLRIGAYWLEDGARWELADVPGADALSIALDLGRDGM